MLYLIAEPKHRRVFLPLPTRPRPPPLLIVAAIIDAAEIPPRLQLRTKFTEPVLCPASPRRLWSKPHRKPSTTAGVLCSPASDDAAAVPALLCPAMTTQLQQRCPVLISPSPLQRRAQSAPSAAHRCSLLPPATISAAVDSGSVPPLFSHRQAASQAALFSYRAALPSICRRSHGLPLRRTSLSL